MKKSDLYEVAIKVLGLYLFVVLINQLKELGAYAAIPNTPIWQPRLFKHYQSRQSDGCHDNQLFTIIIVHGIINFSN